MFWGGFGFGEAVQDWLEGVEAFGQSVHCGDEVLGDCQLADLGLDFFLGGGAKFSLS